MLYITSVQPTGMFSYGPCDPIRLNENKLVHLVGVNEDKNGDSNGSGKTSLFNSICRILFGKDPTNVKSSEVSNVLWGEGFAGRVEFVSWEGVYYRVTDCRDWKNKGYYPVDNDNQVSYKGTNLFFDRWDGTRWVDSRAEGMEATRRLILKAIGMSYKRFIAISYLSHREGSSFLRGKNQERLDVLSGVSGVEEWDKKLQEIRDKRTPLNREIGEKSSDLTYKEGQFSILTQQLDSIINTDWDNSIAQCSRNKDSLNADILALQQILESIQVRHELILNEDREVDTEEVSLSSERDELIKKQVQLQTQSNIPFVDSQDLLDIKSEISRLQGVRFSYNNETGLMNMEVCPTCGHKITKAQKDKISKKIREVDDEISVRGAKYNTLSVGMKKEHENKRTEILGELIKVQKKISQIDTKLVKFRDKHAEHNKRVSTVLKELSSTQSEINKKTSEIFLLDQKIIEFHKKKEEKERVVLLVDNAKKEIEGLKKKIGGIKDKVDIYDWFVENIPYIKLHKLSVTMKILSDKVNSYFENMGDSTRISISPFKEKLKKKNVDMKDLLKGEINVEITDGGKSIDTRLYSDGETAKISNALIRSLHDVALSNGHGCNLILLDEIFSFVDSNNSQKIAESFLSNLSGMTLVTDNSGAAKDLMTFDETWVARKRNGFTTLEVTK